MKPQLQPSFRSPGQERVNSAKSYQDCQGDGAHMQKLRAGFVQSNVEKASGILLLSSATEWEVREKSDPNSSQ